MLRVASSSYCLEQSLIDLHQLLCELCYSSRLDTWENVTLTPGQADVVLITVHKWKELLFLTQDFAISHSQNISILLNSTMMAIALLNCRLVISGVAEAFIFALLFIWVIHLLWDE